MDGVPRITEANQYKIVQLSWFFCLFDSPIHVVAPYMLSKLYLYFSYVIPNAPMLYLHLPRFSLPLFSLDVEHLELWFICYRRGAGFAFSSSRTVISSFEFPCILWAWVFNNSDCRKFCRVFFRELAPIIPNFLRSSVTQTHRSARIRGKLKVKWALFWRNPTAQTLLVAQAIFRASWSRKIFEHALLTRTV